jgi:hypothetical protein
MAERFAPGSRFIARQPPCDRLLGQPLAFNGIGDACNHVRRTRRQLSLSHTLLDFL